jgi:predicted transcriptional regulator YdeE
VEHRIVDLPAFTVVGLGVDCPGFDTSGLAGAWERFLSRMGELPAEGTFGAGLPRQNGFYYVAGAKVPAGTSVPTGMEAAAIPGAKYFSVHFAGQPSQMGAAFSRMFSELIPAAGLQFAPGPVCLEEYGPDCHDAATGTLSCDLYVQLA